MQGDAGVPASVMLTDIPATVTLAHRGPLLFGATAIRTEPGPEPPGPTVSQFAALAVLHAHPGGVVTFTITEPPVSEKDIEVGVSEYVQVVLVVLTADRKLATVAAFRFNACALSCVAVPVGRSP